MLKFILASVPRSRLPLAVALGALLVAPVVAAEEEEAAYGSDATLCYECHPGIQEHWDATKHAKIFNETNAWNERMEQGCAACHGNVQAHVEAGGGADTEGLVRFGSTDPDAIETENAVCLDCHEGGHQMYWEGSVHESRDLACTTCHSSHNARSEHAQLIGKTQTETCGTCHMIQRSQIHRESRMPLREGHMNCGSCHNPHGTVGPSLIAHNTVNDNCLSCHADKRGPHLWEHPPVTENCLNCHVPHGSSKDHMLRLSEPRLCQQCHVATRHPSEPHAPGDRFVVGSSCTNCHINIHGSNHPSGFVFSR